MAVAPGRHPLAGLAPRSSSRRAAWRVAWRARRLARLAERLQGAAMTGGHGERTRCQGAGIERRALTWRFDLEQLERVSTLDGRTLLTAFESRTHDRPHRRAGDRVKGFSCRSAR